MDTTMTAFNQQDHNVLLILGEVRGDVKGIAKALSTLDANINAVEATSDVRFSKLEARLSALESIKTRIGGLAIGVGLVSGLTVQKIPALIQAVMGG